MSEPYAREILRRNVAQICQTIGWNGINSTPLDILVHILEKYIRTLGTQANRYAEQFNRTEPNLHDLGLVFRDLHVELPELAEYTRCVPPVPTPVHTETFPKPKESNLNFLKPGSHEVVTRPMHVHEHLPPMYPEKEQDTPAVAGTVEIRQNGIDNAENNSAACTSPEISVTDSPEKPKDIFKRPIDPVVMPNIKRPRLRLDDEERTREISSVMMTMSGFLSPAREGKLPEARPPTIMSEKHIEKHKTNSHHSNATKVPVVEKSEKKSRKNKLLNGKIVKSKRKDKSHKGESGKSKVSNKLNKCPPGHPKKPKDIHQTQNHLTKPVRKVVPTPSKSAMPPPPPPPPPPPALLPPLPPLPPPPLPPVLVPELTKQEGTDLPTSTVSKNLIPAEDSIPVPRKIPISKSPLVSNTIPSQKNSSSTSSPDIDVKKDVIAEEEKLASQPDRSKINIFKRISNKSKEDKVASEVASEKSQSDNLISKSHISVNENMSEDKPNETIRTKNDDTVVNNNDTSAVDLSKEMDLRAHEVISIDDDSLESIPLPPPRTSYIEPCVSLPFNKSLPPPYPKDLTNVGPKMKKEKKHKDKKDKAARLEAKLLKKQQQQLAYEMAQAEKQSQKLTNVKPSKSSRPKTESQSASAPIQPGYPFFSAVPQGRNLMPGPGLIPNSTLIPGNELFSLANNPALRGSNLLSNTFAYSPGGSGLITGLGAGIPNSLMHMGNFPHTSRSPSMKIPPLLRRPSLEVIPVDNDEERGIHKSQSLAHDKDRHDRHKSPTIPNILQKHKSKYLKDHKSNLFKMPPVQPDITIELNPPKIEPAKQELPRDPPPAKSPTPEPIALPTVEPLPDPKLPTSDVSHERGSENVKKKDKSHKKDKKDKDGIKIKKKKDKKDKNKNKSEKKRDKVEKQVLKDKIKKEKKDKKKAKVSDGVVPKITLKLGSSNSNSPMIKKGEEQRSPVKEQSISREHSRSPELAQISALVTRPPKQKHSKHNHIADLETQVSSPPSGSSPPRKNRPPSSHSKYKRILFKPLSKKGHFEDDSATVSDETAPPQSETIDKPSGPLPTPYYVDEQGNKIWVCPACGRPDNGSPMIGCDGCDGWYHWLCVGIAEEPGATEDWFCKSCHAKRSAMVLAGVTSGKKRGRKPKVEKVSDCH